MFLKILLYLLLKKVIGKVVSLEQWVYIEGRSILDEPLVINELYTWAKKTKKKVLIFKVDSEKAFDSNWGFLDSVMEKMDSSNKWHGWIKGCLSSSRVSILVNGSAMKQFDIKRDVRQCDPLSSFLFILAMEGLNIAMKEACNQNWYQGIFLRNEDACLSHLMYADDVTFIGEWSEMNFVNLNRILRCFYLSSGLKVNLHKSKVYGVGVENIEINRLASILCCEPANFPFSYLGLPIEANMNLSKNWKPIIDKFNSKLSKWKSNNSLSRDVLRLSNPF